MTRELDIGTRGGCILITATLVVLLVIPSIALWGLWQTNRNPQLQVSWVTLHMGEGSDRWDQAVPCVWLPSWRGPSDLQCGWNQAKTVAGKWSNTIPDGVPDDAPDSRPDVRRWLP